MLEAMMLLKLLEVLMNNTETLSLSPEATKRALDIIHQKTSNGLVLTSSKSQTDIVEWFFNDGSFVELVIVRELNDNNVNEVYAAVTQWERRSLFQITIADSDTYEII